MNAFFLRRVLKDPKVRRRETKKSNSLAVITFVDFEDEAEVLDESTCFYILDLTL
jgi:hypothetical protein